MTYARPDALVSTEWLAGHLDRARRAHRRRLVLPAGAEARSEGGVRQAAHSRRGVFRHRRDRRQDQPAAAHAALARAVRGARSALGIGNGNKIVVYDTTPMTGACRVWWMFRAMGHKDVAILDGGLPKWMAEGRAVTDAATVPRGKPFTPHFDKTLVRSIDDVKSLLGNKKEQVVDARAANRFRGEVPEARADLRIGHMPGAFNLPYNDLIDPRTGTMRPDAETQGRDRRVRHRSVEEGDGELRLRRHRLRRGARPLSHGRAGRRDLRRLVDRMGRTCRHADRHRSLIFRAPSAAARRRPAHDHDHLSRDRAARLDAARHGAAIAEIDVAPVIAPTVRVLSRSLRPGRPALAVVRAPRAHRPGAGLAYSRRPTHELHVARHAGELVGYFELLAGEIVFFGLDARLYRPAHRPVAARPRDRARFCAGASPADPQHQHPRSSARPRHLSQGGISYRSAGDEGCSRPADPLAGRVSLAADVTAVP